MVPLGEWVIRNGVQLAHRHETPVMVNLSAKQLASPGLARVVRDALREAALPADQLGFELTETLLLADFEYSVAIIRQLRDLGCSVGLDDFGTGYSSLSYLRRLPIDFLKLDRTLVAGVDTEPQARAVATGVVQIADALGVDVVAEGVETEDQLSALSAIGCPYAQGFLLGAPSHAEISGSRETYRAGN